MTERFELSCCCGARLNYTGSYPSTAAQKFYKVHQLCIERERPLVMWGGDQA